jgi:hypothetical protein
MFLKTMMPVLLQDVTKSSPVKDIMMTANLFMILTNFSRTDKTYANASANFATSVALAAIFLSHNFHHLNDRDN